jgi:hypothetical protein
MREFCPCYLGFLERLEGVGEMVWESMWDIG